jgi:hypothetical protein
VQPLSETTHTRPWHWGIAIGRAVGGELPDLTGNQIVKVGHAGLVVRVRHAQDIDAERFEGDWNWATATVQVRSLTEAESVSRQVLCATVMPTPDERIHIGDADGEVVLPAPSDRTHVIVSADDADETGLMETSAVRATR